MDYLLCHLLICIIGIQFPLILFGYKSGVQVNIKFFLFMVMIGRIPRFTCDNNLATFTNVEKEKLTLEEMT
jgi:hypothetical protein